LNRAVRGEGFAEDDLALSFRVEERLQDRCSGAGRRSRFRNLAGEERENGGEERKRAAEHAGFSHATASKDDKYATASLPPYHAMVFFNPSQEGCPGRAGGIYGQRP